MAKIFVSYKHSDRLVRQLPTTNLLVGSITARNYVNELVSKLQYTNHIYKGENDNESLADFKDETIQTKLSGKIYDSSVTIVLLSKGMKESWKKESDQWIPWEVSYSLRNKTRGGRTSQMNAMLAVVLPDDNGRYDYWPHTTFSIILMNMLNVKDYYKNQVSKDYHSYIHLIHWDGFIKDPGYYIQVAQSIRSNSNMYDIKAGIND